MAKHIIYALIDPRTSLVNYIGKSSSGLKRPNGHMSKERLARDKTTRGDWLRQLVALGLRYEVRVLEEVESFALDEAERRWIEIARREDWPLTNMTDGGDGMGGYKMPMERRLRLKEEWATGKRKHSPEVIAGLKALKTGVPRSEETKAKIREACRRPEAVAKMSAANKGKERTEAHRLAAGLARKGKRPSAETLAKLSAARKGKKRPPSVGEKVRAAKLGKPRPDLAAWHKTEAAKAHRERLREMSVGRKRPDVASRNATPEKRAQLSAALKGRVFSEETIAKMRAAQQRRQAAARAARAALNRI
jgi:hypothetical protein